MKKRIRLGVGLLVAVLIIGVAVAEICGHVPICSGSQSHGVGICWGYAQGRAFGKSPGDPECDPRTLRASSINESYFAFVNDNTLAGIAPGDIVRFSGHAAYVVEVPNPLVIGNIRVDQIRYEGGPEDTYIKLSDVITQQGSNPIGYHHGSGAGNRVDVTFENSFGHGSMGVGQDKFGNWITRSNGWTGAYFQGSPLALNAFDPQTDAQGNTQRFWYWKWNGADNGSTNPRTVTIQGSGTYRAEFEREFTVTLVNDLPGASGGTIVVDNDSHAAPYGAKVREQTHPTITVNAPTQTLDNVVFTFSRWQDFSTTNPRDFTETSNVTRTATYTAKPNPPTSVAAQGSVGQNVVVSWHKNMNQGVTQQRIWRKPKHGNPVNVVTFYNNQDSLWTDQDVIVTGTGSDSMFTYSVQCYYNPSSTWSDEASAIIWAVYSPRIELPSLPAFQEATIPSSFAVASYPNPFNPSTTISYALPKEALIRLEIFDVTGRKVRSLLNVGRSAGHYSVVWNSTDDSGRDVSSGVYFYQFVAASLNGEKPFKQSGKLVLTR
jgi:hypothetical protein